MEREQPERQRRAMDVHRLEERIKDGYLASLQPYPHWVVWTLLEDKHGDMKKVPSPLALAKLPGQPTLIPGTHYP